MTASNETSDALLVRPARGRGLLVIAAALALVGALVLAAFGWPPTVRWRIGDVVTLIILGPLAVVLLVAALRLLLPQPLFSIGHAGIRVYLVYGLFGNAFIPWSRVSRMVTYQRSGQRVFAMYGDTARPGHDRIRAQVSSLALAGSLDELLEALSERFGRELDAHHVKLIDYGAHWQAVSHPPREDELEAPD